MRPLVVANWKAQLTPRRERELAHLVARRLLAAPDIAGAVDLVLAPSALSLVVIEHDLVELGLAVALAAQDCSPDEKGAHTGELAATAIAEVAGLVLLGHAERRRDRGEAGALLGRKLARAVAAGLRPILCFDDPLEGSLRSRGAHFAAEWNATTAAAAALGVDSAALLRAGLVLAYEPQASIGSGEPLALSAAGEAAAALRDVAKLDLPVLYGGSVAGTGAAAYLATTGERRLDGLLVGGAALDAGRLLAILAALGG